MKKYSTIIGMDLGDRYCYWARMSQDNEEILEENRVRTTQTAVRRLFSRMEPARVAIEVGTHSPWIGEVLEACGHEVLIGNARKLRMIYTNEKTGLNVPVFSLYHPAYLSRLLRQKREEGLDAYNACVADLRKAAQIGGLVEE